MGGFTIKGETIIVNGGNYIEVVAEKSRGIFGTRIYK